jgi:hypothetical protein
MLLRKLLLAAAIVAPLASMPSAVSAQEHGRDRANVAGARAEEHHAWDHGRAKGRRNELPKGIARGAGGSTLPPGIRRTRHTEPDVQPEPEVQPEPDVQPDPPPEPPTVCDTTLVYVGGLPYLQDCNGNQTPLF